MKYFLDGKVYVCLTNDPEINRGEVKRVDASRRRIEESFKRLKCNLRLKSNLKLEKAHARTPDLYIQEIEARVFLDTITLRTQQKHNETSYLFTLDLRVNNMCRRVTIRFSGSETGFDSFSVCGSTPPSREPPDPRRKLSVNIGTLSPPSSTEQ